MSSVKPSDDVEFDSEVPLLIIGAGAAGLCAALAASEAGIEPVLIERDAVPSGSTALSAGLFPAAGARFPRGGGGAGKPGRFSRGVWRQARHQGGAEPGANRAP